MAKSFDEIPFKELPVAARMIRIIEAVGGEIECGILLRLCKCTDDEFREGLEIIRNPDNQNAEFFIRIPQRRVK